MRDLWDQFYFEFWIENNADDPTYEDYQDWLFDRADKALGEE